MSELKTLKDIETINFQRHPKELVAKIITGIPNLDRDIDEKYNNCTSYHFVDFRELKQEAIKWVKELWSNGTCGIGEESDNSDSMIAWIKHFFDINESEIKNA